MRKYLLILLTLLPLLGFAKEKKDNSNPKYLVGAVTLNEEGKISFSKEIKAPSLSKKELYDIMLKWANGRFKSDGKLISRVVYTDEEKGDIAASAEEYVVFSSSALSLDRTRIYYQYFINVQDGACNMTMTRIRYWYDENRDGGQKYTAEEWITDDMALNKKKTKLAPICGKFRRETIDLKDALFKSAADAIGEKTISVVTPVAPATAAAGGELRSIKIGELPSNLDEIAAKGRITFTADGEEMEIKQENWGGFGKLFDNDWRSSCFNCDAVPGRQLVAWQLLAQHRNVVHLWVFALRGQAQSDERAGLHVRHGVGRHINRKINAASQKVGHRGEAPSIRNVLKSEPCAFRKHHCGKMTRGSNSSRPVTKRGVAFFSAR